MIALLRVVSIRTVAARSAGKSEEQKRRSEDRPLHEMGKGRSSRLGTGTHKPRKSGLYTNSPSATSFDIALVFGLRPAWVGSPSSILAMRRARAAGGRSTKRAARGPGRAGGAMDGHTLERARA